MYIAKLVLVAGTYVHIKFTHTYMQFADLKS